MKYDDIEQAIRAKVAAREAGTSHPLIWGGIGLLMVLFFAYVLTTRWF